MVDVVEEAYRQAVTSSHLVEDLGHTAAQLSNVTGVLEKMVKMDCSKFLSKISSNDDTPDF